MTQEPKLFPYIARLLQDAEVVWTTLGDEKKIEIANANRRPVKASERISGNIPYYGANNIQDYVEGYTHEGTYILIAEDGTKSIENYSVQWATGKFWANNHVHVLRCKKNVDSRFIYYYLQTVNFVPFLAGGDRAKLTKAKLLEIPIPLSPLSVQQEIVRILDTFTTLEAELEAELEARKKQYEYYRDDLLTFGDEVEWRTLGEISLLYGGLTGKNKTDFEEGNASYISYKNIFDNIEIDFDKLEKVKVAISENQNKVRYGDVLFTGSSETSEEAGMSSAITTEVNDNVYLNSFSFGLRFNDDIEITPDFSKHLFRSHFMRIAISKTASGVTRFNISKEKFKKIKIPLPPLSEQQRIAAILDKFDTLTASISEGLPREIELRKKQYEYYREQLLSFPGHKVTA